MSNWIKREDYRHKEAILIGFFWAYLSDGTVELAYGDPIGAPIWAECAGDREGHIGEDVTPFDYFMWLETPEGPAF